MKNFEVDVSGCTDQLEDIAQSALALPADLRAILVDRLLESLVTKT